MTIGLNQALKAAEISLKGTWDPDHSDRSAFLDGASWVELNPHGDLDRKISSLRRENGTHQSLRWAFGLGADWALSLS